MCACERLPVPPSTVAIATTEAKILQAEFQFTIGPSYLGDMFMIFKLLNGKIFGSTFFGENDATINCTKRILHTAIPRLHLRT